jgi:hypothetical protein
MYHVRNHTPLAERTEGERKALSQSEAILALFKSRGGKWTPFEVSRLLDDMWPITSIRRGLTDLTTAGYLQKDARERKAGELGATNSTWSLADNKPQTELFR